MTVTINGTTGITNDGGYTGDGVVFADTTPANTLVTTTGGNVGIGTSSPTVKLDVNGLCNFGGSSGVRAGVGTAFVGGQAELYAQGAVQLGVGTAGSQPLNFYTNSTERMRIDSSGRLLVAMTTPLNAGNEGANVQIKGTSVTPLAMDQGDNNFYVAFWSKGTTSLAGSIQKGSGLTTSYVTSSDYRAKEDVQPMTGALAKVVALKPVTYKWKVDGSDGQGFIAHELQEVVPDCVTGEKDAVDAEGNPQYQGIDTSFLVATLTAAIQEQQALIASQSAIILAQQTALTALTARVEALENK
jgi:hypothetical protein